MAKSLALTIVRHDGANGPQAVYSRPSGVRTARAYPVAEALTGRTMTGTGKPRIFCLRNGMIANKFRTLHSIEANAEAIVVAMHSPVNCQRVS